MGRLSPGCWRADPGAIGCAFRGATSCLRTSPSEPSGTGKKLGIYELGKSGNLLLTVIAAQVGLDSHKDIEWVPRPTGNAMELFAEGKVDAFSRTPARTTGVARPRDRSGDPQHDPG